MKIDQIEKLATHFEKTTTWSGVQVLAEAIDKPLYSAIANINSGDLSVAKKHIQKSLSMLKAISVANSFNSFLKIAANPFEQETNPDIRPAKPKIVSTPSGTISYVIGSLNFAIGLIDNDPEKAKSILINTKKSLIQELQQENPNILENIEDIEDTSYAFDEGTEMNYDINGFRSLAPDEVKESFEYMASSNGFDFINYNVADIPDYDPDEIPSFDTNSKDFIHDGGNDWRWEPDDRSYHYDNGEWVESA